MNNMRRKEIEETMKELSILANKLAEVVETINRINEDEEEYRDNVPENLQESDRYYASEEASCSIEEAINYLDDLPEYINDAITCLSDAKSN